MLKCHENSPGIIYQKECIDVKPMISSVKPMITSESATKKKCVSKLCSKQQVTFMKVNKVGSAIWQRSLETQFLLSPKFS